MEEEIPRVCRICFEDEAEDKILIAPCHCKGFSKFIHEECLKTWITIQEQYKVPIRCEVCKYRYKIEREPRRKCDPREGMQLNPHLICYLGILILITTVLLIIVYVLISRNYINPQENFVYFLGILVFSYSQSLVQWVL